MDSAAALSPDRRALALATEPFLRGPGRRLAVVDPFDRGSPGGLVWPTKRRLYALEAVFGPDDDQVWSSPTTHRLVVLDPTTLRRRGARPLAGFGGPPAHTAGGAFTVRTQRDRGVLVYVHRPGTGPRSIRIPVVGAPDAGFVRRRGDLPAAARAAVGLARASLATQQPRPGAAVETIAVERRLVNDCAGREDDVTFYHPGYVVYLRRAGRDVAYAFEVNRPGGPAATPCWRGVAHALAEPHRPTDRDLLRLPAGTWLSTATDVAPDAAGTRLAVVGAGAPLFAVDLRSLRVRRHASLLPDRMWESGTHGSRWLDRHRLVVSTGTATFLVDLGRRTARRLGPGHLVGTTPGRVLLRDERRHTIDARTFSGRLVYRRRAHPTPDENVVCGNRLVVREWPEAVDLVYRVYAARDGRLLARGRLPAGTRMLPDASPACR